MGDHGRLYVNPDLVPLYAESILALASIITPNQFEAEKLLGRKISTDQDALAACRELHCRGPHTVVGYSAYTQVPARQNCEKERQE